MRRVLIPELATPPAPPPPGAAVATLSGRTMGTSWTVKLVPPAGLDPGGLVGAIQAELDAVCAQMSPWDPNSDLVRFNRAEAGSWRELPAGFFSVLSHALALARDTGGAYDPAVGALVDLWGFGPAGPRHAPPADEQVARGRSAPGWRDLRLEPAGRRAWQPGGVRLDLCSIAKGFGVDQVAALLRRLGATSFLVEVGGELLGEGIKPDLSPWWVALEAPPRMAAPQTVIALCGLAVATSGDYRRFFDHDGRRYGHTIDPRTGRPLADGPVSVSVLHPSAMAADALATALSVLGCKEGLAFADARGLAAHFVSPAGEEYLSRAFAAMAG